MYVCLKVRAMSLILHKVACQSDADDIDTGHVFTFVWDDVARLQMTSSSVRSVESSEVKYAGHVWSVVCTRKVSLHSHTASLLVVIGCC